MRGLVMSAPAGELTPGMKDEYTALGSAKQAEVGPAWDSEVAGAFGDCLKEMLAKTSGY